MHPGQSRSWFVRFTKATSRATGNRFAFGAALLIVIAWLVSGPIFHWSDTWQLIVNTGTTIITFLMVFLIQSTQNRDAVALQVKLDELLRVTSGAHNVLMDLEELEEEELDHIHARYRKLAQQARKDLRRGKADTGVGEV